MYNLKYLFLIIVIVFSFTSCKDDGGEDAKLPGTVELKFDNVAIVNNVAKQLNLVTPGSTTYDYENAMGQKYNINLLRYYISAIELSGPNGEVFKDEVKVDANTSKGYYLIDEAVAASQLIELSNVPAGEYNKVTFTVGVDSSGVVNGAAGGSLDPATSNMFWNWNSGYIALKYEGQSDVSNGGAGGETINNISNGMAYHVGGWKNIAGTAFVYNNKRITLDFDSKMVVEQKYAPEAHLYFDVIKMFNSPNVVDFTGNHNVHRPLDGQAMANNIATAFIFDHIHQ